MKTEIAIVTDTSSDIPRHILNKYENLFLAEAYVVFGTHSYSSNELTMQEFYAKTEKASKHNFPRTSQASPQDFLEVYEKVKENGYRTILSIHVSGKLSGTINSANVAADMIKGIDIKVIDTHSASFPVTACILKALELIGNLGVDDIVNEVEAFGSSLQGYFTLKSLTNLNRSGRIGLVKYRFAKLFNIKPILYVGQDEVKLVSKAMGFNKARQNIYSLATSNRDSTKQLTYIIAHSEQFQEAKQLELKLKQDFPISQGFIAEIGKVIGVHTGRNGIFLMTYQ
jgi:DegV family protein with EDD domain